MKHPAIDLSLTALGIVKDVKDNRRKGRSSLCIVTNLEVAFDYQVVIIIEDERQKFLQLEDSACKGI